MSAFGAISFVEIGALIVALIASFTDIRTGKILNALTFPAALVGILARAAMYAMQQPDSPVASGIAGAINAVCGWLLAVLIMSVLKIFLPKQGHGDTKLLAAIGAFVGPAMLIGSFMYFCFSYSLFTCTKMALTVPWRQLTTAYMGGSLAGVDFERLRVSRKEPVPMAPFIAAGLVLMIVLKQPTLGFLGFNH